jgi:cytochrome P450
MVTEAQHLLDGPFAAAAAANARQPQAHQQRQHAPTAATAAAAAGLPAGVRDVYADFNQLTLNITLSALFSIRSDYDGSSSSNRAAVIVAAVEKAFGYFAARGATAMVVPEWVPTPDNVAFREAVQQLDELVYGIIDSRQAVLTQQQQQQVQAQDGVDSSSSSKAAADLLQALLESQDDDGRPMSRTALRDELMTLLVAGEGS